MDVATAQLLAGPQGRTVLAEAAQQEDPASLHAAEQLRRRWDGDVAAAALAQETLRRRAVSKIGPDARALLFTSAGLEQATRPAVAAWRAHRLARHGVRRIVDLGCGLGLDARAFAAAGLEVTAVDTDPVTAVFAQHNVPAATVTTGDAATAAATLLRPGDAAFVDPARRTSSGRLWRVEDFSPPWALVQDLLGERRTCVKLGPALPHRLIPAGAEATWVSHRGDVVEVSLWSGPDIAAGRRSAVLLPDAHGHDAPEPLTLEAVTGAVPVGPPGRYVLEPDGAVIRAGALAQLAELVDGWLLAPHIAYLATDAPTATVWATCFEVLDALPFNEKVLRTWVRAHDIGTLEIKKRGVDVDPAVLRRRLRPHGRASATLILTPTTTGAQVLVVHRRRP